MIVKADSVGCVGAQFLAYSASADRALPASLSLGGVVGGTDFVVTLGVSQDSRRAELRLRHVGARLIIRRVAGMLAVTLSWPAVLATAPPPPHLQLLQLCMSGCPHGQLLLLPIAPHRRLSLITAQRKCVASQLHGNLLDSCVFDLVATGDVTYVQAAVLAKVDLATLAPSALELRNNRTVFWTRQQKVVRPTNTSAAVVITNSGYRRLSAPPLLVTVVLTVVVIGRLT